MIAHGSIRGLVAFVVLGCGAAVAQSTLPPMAPTVLDKPAHRAVVVLARGQLTVIAENSSLNEILRDIARRTGIKIKGGVIDEQVYGTYGPAAPAAVLATLLEDTSSNMMLAEEPRSAMVELILTPRQGGPTPPNPQPVEAEVAHNEVPAPEVQERPVAQDPAAVADQGDAIAESEPEKPAPEPGSVAEAKPSATGDASATSIAQNQTLTSLF